MTNENGQIPEAKHCTPPITGGNGDAEGAGGWAGPGGGGGIDAFVVKPEGANVCALLASSRI